MLIITIQIMAVLSMLVFMFIGIWGFILLIKIYNQLRYKNYLMEKLIHNTSNLSLIHENKDPTNSDPNPSYNTELTENEILDLNIKKDVI